MPDVRRRRSLMDMALGDEGRAETSDQYRRLPLELLRSGPWQLRSRFDDAGLDELARTLRAQGVIEPLIVRSEGDHYLIIAGERRWRAAQRAGLATVPCIVKTGLSDHDAGLWNLLENLQREDLNPVDEGRGYETALKHYGLTQQALSESLGVPVDRMTRMRHLLELDPEVQELVAEGALRASHALVLRELSAPLQRELARAAIEGDWSVQVLKDQVQRLRQRPARRRRTPMDPAIRSLTERLQQYLGASVTLKPSASSPARGELRIRYHSLDELDGLLAKIGLPGEDCDR